MDNFNSLNGNETETTVNYNSQTVFQADPTVNYDYQSTNQTESNGSEEAYISYEEDKKNKKKYFASPMWKLVLALVVIFAVQLIFIIPESIIVGLISGIKRPTNDFMRFLIRINEKGIVNSFHSRYTLISLVLSDLAGLGFYKLITLKNEITAPEKKKIKFGYLVVMYFICFGFGGVGSIVGNLTDLLIMSPVYIVKVLGSLTGGLLSGSNNVVQSVIAADNSWAYIFIEILIVGIIVPIVEELIFRKMLINRLSKFGYAPAVLLSALAFAIFHGNFQQFFYALLLGIMFGYVYAYSGKIRYSVLLHMGYNLYAAAVFPFVMKFIPSQMIERLQFYTEKFESSMNFERYMNQIGFLIKKFPIGTLAIVATAIAYLVYLLFILIGIIMFIIFIKKGLNTRKSLFLGEKGIKGMAMLNYGTIIFLVFGTGFIIFNYGCKYVGGLLTLLK